MTPTQQKAMEMALEALMHVDECTFVNDAGSFDLLNLYEDKHVCEAIKALRAALAERQPLFKPLIDQLPGLAEELAEQANDKTDMTIKLPPMPETDWNLYMLAKHYEAAWTSTEPGYTAGDMEAYAREAVRLNMAPLSDEQILEFVKKAPALDTAEAEWLHVARAIEAAHGIKGD